MLKITVSNQKNSLGFGPQLCIVPCTYIIVQEAPGRLRLRWLKKTELTGQNTIFYAKICIRNRFHFPGFGKMPLVKNGLANQVSIGDNHTVCPIGAFYIDLLDDY